MSRRTYNVKLQDFCPFIGSFIYQNRNWKGTDKKLNGKLKEPEPYLEYVSIAVGLAALNVTTGIASVYLTFKGLEALLR